MITIVYIENGCWTKDLFENWLFGVSGGFWILVIRNGDGFVFCWSIVWKFCRWLVIMFQYCHLEIVPKNFRYSRIWSHTCEHVYSISFGSWPRPLTLSHRYGCDSGTHWSQSSRGWKNTPKHRDIHTRRTWHRGHWWVHRCVTWIGYKKLFCSSSFLQVFVIITILFCRSCIHDLNMIWMVPQKVFFYVVYVLSSLYSCLKNVWQLVFRHQVYHRINLLNSSRRFFSDFVIPRLLEFVTTVAQQVLLIVVQSHILISISRDLFYFIVLYSLILRLAKMVLIL